MNGFVIGTPVYSVEGGKSKVSATIQCGERNFNLWYRVSQGPVSQTGNPFLVAGLFLAMKAGQTLSLTGQTVSPRLVAASATIQDIFNKWYPECAKVEVKAHASAPQGGLLPTRGVACFFSGGLDSFYTLLKHQSEITHLILIHGFDMWLEDERLRALVSKELNNVAARLGKPLIEVETNLRDIGDEYLDWGLHYFGSGLASVALLLSPQFAKVYIPSSETYAHLEPCGSHPLLDPLWSTEQTSIVHDGCEATRAEKAAMVSHSDVALSSLRVCYQNLLDRDQNHERSTRYNCGHCEKCLRTMLNLRAAGALERCTTFERTLDPAEVARIDPEYDLALFHVVDNLRALEVAGRDPDLIQALHQSINRYHRRKIVQGLNAQLENIVDSDAWRDLVQRRKQTLFKSLWSILGTWIAQEAFKGMLKEWDRRWSRGTLSKIVKPSRYEDIPIGATIKFLPRALARMQYMARKNSILHNQKDSALILPPAAPGSLGDEAMLEATAMELRRRGFRRIGVCTYDSQTSYAWANEHIALAEYFDTDNQAALVQLVKAMMRYRHLLVIGADVMDGYYSVHESQQRISIAFLGGLAGLETTVLGFSFNAAPSPESIDALTKLPTPVRLCARDPVSLARLDQTVGPRAGLVADLAFLLHPRESSQIRKYTDWTQVQRNHGRTVVGINANALALADRGNQSSRALIEGYVALIIRLSEQRGNLSFVLIPHDTRGLHSDIAIAAKIFQRLPNEVAANVLNASASMAASEIKALCGHLDCLISGRMHLAIAALGMGVPVACIEYQGKFEGLFRHFGIDGMVIDNTQALCFDSIETLLRTLIRNRHGLARKIKARLPDIINLSLMNFSSIADIDTHHSAQYDVPHDNSAGVIYQERTRAVNQEITHYQCSPLTTFNKNRPNL